MEPLLYETAEYRIGFPIYKQTANFFGAGLLSTEEVKITLTKEQLYGLMYALYLYFDNLTGKGPSFDVGVDVGYIRPVDGLYIKIKPTSIITSSYLLSDASKEPNMKYRCHLDRGPVHLAIQFNDEQFMRGYLTGLKTFISPDLPNPAIDQVCSGLTDGIKRLQVKP